MVRTRKNNRMNDPRITHCMECALTGTPNLIKHCPNYQEYGYDCQGIAWDSENKCIIQAPWGFGSSKHKIGPYKGPKDEVVWSGERVVQFNSCPKCGYRLDCCRQSGGCE